MDTDTNRFQDPEFHKKFMNAIKDYNIAIDNNESPPQAAQEFITSLFDSDFDAAFNYAQILENMDDQEAARKLQDIVVNGSLV